jgi:hypothetical protein
VTLDQVPLDAPIPTTEAIYVWDDVGGYWLRWVDWVFAVAHRHEPGGGKAAAPPPAAQSSLF